MDVHERTEKRTTDPVDGMAMIGGVLGRNLVKKLRRHGVMARSGSGGNISRSFDRRRTRQRDALRRYIRLDWSTNRGERDIRLADRSSPGEA